MKQLFCFFIAFVLILFMCTSCNSENQTFETHIFRIDTAIKSTAQQNIWNAEHGNPKYLFLSKLSAEFYTDDILEKIEFDTFNAQMWGRYSWHNDTLTITGNFGDLTSTGFIANVYHDTAYFYHSQCAHTKKRYKNNLSDTLVQCAKVPCSYSQLIISNIPDRTKDEEIFGYVNFRSKDFYSQNGNDIKKLRANMAFYFRAYNYDIYIKRFQTK